MVRQLNILTHCLLWLLLTVIAVACTQSDEPATANGGNGSSETGSVITFRFSIYADDSGVRSRELGVWEENPANAAERILNIDDMRILFFDQSGTLLTTCSPSGLEYAGNNDANDGYYFLSVTFSSDYFDKFEDPDAEIPFQVMILANLKGAGGLYNNYAVGEDRVNDIKDSFALSTAYYPDVKTGIPMYGLKSFTITKRELTESEAPVIGEIDLIRSLCKIEVSDKIVNSFTAPDGNRYPRVISVDMISWVDHGFIRPRNDNYANGLKLANIFPNAQTTETMTGTSVDELTYRFYCPEAHVGDIKFRVKAILAPGETPRDFEIGLEGFSSDIGPDLVRNHIYRFDVHALNTVADLTVEVADWHVETNEFELDNIVSVEPDGFLRWTFETADFAVSTEVYNGNNEEQLSILNGTAAYATGTFHLISPHGATWKAYFIPGENGVDAFEFVDIGSDGNVIAGSEKVVAEGLVGEQATIHIRGKGEADSYRHWAELVVEVHTIDGNILYAPLTPAMSSRFIIYRENRF